jgi:DNA-binding transcriptional ArsR family regulator
MPPPTTQLVFRALSDPTRRSIFEELNRQGDLTVQALTRFAGISQPAVSRHLRLLKQARLVRYRKHGRETHYCAHPQALAPLADWLQRSSAFWRERFDLLETVLQRMDS